MPGTHRAVAAREQLRGLVLLVGLIKCVETSVSRRPDFSLQKFCPKENSNRCSCKQYQAPKIQTNHARGETVFGLTTSRVYV